MVNRSRFAGLPIQRERLVDKESVLNEYATSASGRSHFIV